VLVASESVWDAARRDVVARIGGCWQADATRAMMGMSSPEWSRYMHDQLGVPLKPKQINELVIAALLDQYRRRPLLGSTDEATMRWFILAVALLLDPAAVLLLLAATRPSVMRAMSAHAY
jgi:hypothetical protein